MLMVIFGAGASFDSSPYFAPGSNVGLRPPLANDLFGERYFLQYQSIFPDCIPVVPHLMPRNGASIEDALQRLRNGAATDPRRHTQLASIRYYLRQLFDSLVPQW